MYVNIKNENYGYAVATYGDYVAVSNPSNLRWDITTASVYYTGSVDYFRYNKNTDSHDYIGTLYKEVEEINILLAAETGSPTPPPVTGSLFSASFITETGIYYPEYDLLIDKDTYVTSVEDGYGLSLDMYEKLLVVGSPYYTQAIVTSASFITASGGNVEVHDFARTEFIPASQSCHVASIYNPDSNITESFGKGVSINSSWIAIGSPHVSSSKGMVYLYQNKSTGSNYSWSFFQKLEVSDIETGSMFGSDLKLNKQSGSYSNTLIVGCGNDITNKAYYFLLISGSWTQTFEFNPTSEVYPLTFGNYYPYQPTMSISGGFGKAVSTFGSAVIIGAYQDRTVYEYSGSTLYQQGSVYIFDNCNDISCTNFELKYKTYGNTNILKNNKLGFSVDMFENYALAGSPKINVASITSCDIGGTVDQLHFETPDDNFVGQAMLLNRNTSSGDWSITNIYQRRKKYLTPYRGYGFDVSIDGRSMVVGAPMFLSDTNRRLNLYTTYSNGVELTDISGKAYIYNMANLRNDFYVGNVFYRNGKIVVMTSGSAFDGLFYNPTNTNTYEYDLQFKGKHTIFEKQVVCNVSPGEFNVSTNPTSIIKRTGSLDINKNGVFDFQDVDIVLRYMQYKNTSILGVPVSTNWSSSIIISDDERSLYNYYINQSSYNPTQTSEFTSESILKWEFTDTSIQDVLDLNEDNKIDTRDMNIVWKYFSNRLTQENYSTYITPSCKKRLFSDIIDHMNTVTQRTSIPEIKPEFSDYERMTATDKTGSFLAPMATTIGIYSGLDLVAIAKLGSPIKITPELPINFVVKMDF